jgi:excisionase family DNA binding protein
MRTDHLRPALDVEPDIAVTPTERARAQVDRLLPSPVATVAETTKLLKVGRTTVFELIAIGSLRSVRLGRRRLVLTVSILDYLAALDAEQNGAH